MQPNNYVESASGNNDAGGNKSYFYDLLRGGLPAVLDFPTGYAPPQATFPEQSAPANAPLPNAANPGAGGFTQQQLTWAALAAFAVVAVYAIAKA